MNDNEEVGFTPGDILPPVVTQPQVPVTIPQPVIAPPDPVVPQPGFTPQPLLQSPTIPAGMDGITRSYSGPTAQGVARSEQQQAQIRGRAQSFAQQDQQSTQQELDQYNQGISREQAAIDSTKQANTDYDLRLQDLTNQQLDLSKEAAKQEEVARQEAKISGAQFMENYSRQLAAVRAMSVDINGPLSKLTDAQRGGTALALFAQGFLAAQGINVNVQGQLDNWVERSIREQTRQIQQAEAGAQDQLNLWNIARQNSHDDLEARQRYRGYILEGLKAQTEMAARRFNSSIAMSQADVAKAKLDQESATTSANMRNAHVTRVLQEKNWQTDNTYKMGMLNIEQQKIGLEREKAANSLKGKKQQIIVDPSDGKAKWVVREDRINAADDAKTSAEAQANYTSLSKLIREAREFKQRHENNMGKYGYFSVFNNIDEARREYTAQTNRIAMEITRANFGKASSDKEADRVRELLPFDKWYQKGNNDTIWTKLDEDVRHSFESIVSAHADAIPENQQQVVPHNTANPAVKAEWEANSKGGKPGANFAQEEVGKVINADSREKPGEHFYPSKLYEKWVGTPADKGGRNREEESDYSFGAAREFREDDAAGDKNTSQWAVALDHLAAGWLRPQEVKEHGDKNYIYFGTKNETAEEIKAESLNAIRQIASGKTETGEEINPLPVQYARWLLKQDEGEARKLILPENDPWTENPVAKVTGLATRNTK